MIYGGDFPRHRIALFAPASRRRPRPATRRPGVLEAASTELASAAQSVIRRLDLPGGPYDIVLSGGTFVAVPSLAQAVTSLLRAPAASVRLLTDEPAMGAVRLALEELT